MAPLTPAVLLSAAADTFTDDVRRILAAHFSVIDHTLGSAPTMEFTPLAVAVIEVGEHLETAAAQTRRWRAELGDRVAPILMILPATATEQIVPALQAGADVCLVRPLDPMVLTAQVKSLARTHAIAARLEMKAAETRLLGDQLRKAYTQLDDEFALSRRVRPAFRPRTLPEVGAARFALHHQSRGRSGGDFFDIQRLDEDHVGFILGSVSGRGTTGSLLGLFLQHVTRGKEITAERYRLIPPDEVLAAANRELLGLHLEDPPLVAMLAGVLNVRNGSVTLARAGLPAPVSLPAAGEPRTWAVPGPFLGTADAAYEPLRGVLSPGDKLIIGSNGIRPEHAVTATPLLEVARQHRALSGTAFVDAVAQELLPHARTGEDFTLLVVEMGNAAGVIKTR